MGLWRWFKERGVAHVDSRLRRWREHWWQAAAAPDQGKITRLAHDLDALAFPEDEIEIEREMLQGPYVLGERYTISDPYLYTLAQWMGADGLDRKRFPKVQAHFERVGARPAVKKALAAEAA